MGALLTVENLLRAGGLAAMPVMANTLVNRQIVSTLRKITASATASPDSTLRKEGDLVQIVSTRYADGVCVESEPPSYFKLSVNHSFVFGDRLKEHYQDRFGADRFGKGKKLTLIQFFEEVHSRKEAVYFQIEYRESGREGVKKERTVFVERMELTKGIGNQIKSLQSANLQWWLIQPALGALITFATSEASFDGSAERAAAAGAVGGLISAGTQKFFSEWNRKMHYLADDHVAPFSTLIHAMVYTVLGTFGILSLLRFLSP